MSRRYGDDPQQDAADAAAEMSGTMSELAADHREAMENVVTVLNLIHRQLILIRKAIESNGL